MVVILLNAIAVFLAGMGDTAEDIYEAIRESATCVVMTANVKRGHVVPEIEINVVLLTLVVGLILINTGASDN